MLDVVFIMRVFHCHRLFVNESGVDVNRPPTSEEPPPDSDNTNIVFHLGKQRAYPGGPSYRCPLCPCKCRAYAENPEAKVVVSAHPKSKTELFVLISDQSREAGVYDVSLSTDE